MAVKECEINGIVIANSDTPITNWKSAFSSSTNYTDISLNCRDDLDLHGTNAPYYKEVTYIEFSIPDIIGKADSIEMNFYKEDIDDLICFSEYYGNDGSLYGASYWPMRFYLCHVDYDTGVYPKYQDYLYNQFMNDYVGGMLSEEVTDDTIIYNNEYEMYNSNIKINNLGGQLQSNHTYVLIIAPTETGTDFYVDFEMVLKSIKIHYSSGLVYIDNGSKLVPYQCFIDNGSSWDQYMPYVDNGSSWDLCS